MIRNEILDTKKRQSQNLLPENDANEIYFQCHIKQYMNEKSNSSFVLNDIRLLFRELIFKYNTSPKLHS